MASAFCPDCDEEITVRSPWVGQTLFCPYCDAEVEVISVDPLDLNWVYASSHDAWLEDDD